MKPYKFFVKSIIGFLSLLFFIAGQAKAQNPYHFFLGEEELAAIDVYDINQTNDGVYWIATNKGIFSYNGYSFSKYQHDATLSSSFFNITKDYNDAVYFNNLNGQIFKIINGNIELVHTIPDSLLAPYVSINFLKDNSLVVRSYGCYTVKNNEINVLVERNKRDNVLSSLTQDDKNNLLLQLNNQTLIKITDTGVEEIKISFEDQQDNLSLNILNFFYHSTGILVNGNGKYIFKAVELGHNQLHLSKVKTTVDAFSRIHFNSDKFMVSNHRFGVRTYNYDFANRQTPRLLFKKHYISAIFEDANGNILLGTFGDGIIVIPKTGVENMAIGNQIRISKIISNQKGGLYLGGFNGNVYDYNESAIDTLYNRGSKLIETLYYIEGQGLLFDQRKPNIINIENKQLNILNLGAVKDVVKIDSSSFGIATNVGAHRAEMHEGREPVLTDFYKGRTYAISYDGNNQKYYIASSQGLIAVDSSSNERLVYYNDNPLMVNDIEYTSKGILVGTKNYGLLKVSGLDVTPFIDESQGLLSNYVEQFKVSNNWVIIATELGFQIFNKSGDLLKTLSASDGLKSSKVWDFDIDNSYLWMLHKNGLQRIRINQLLSQETSHISKISEVRLYVNDEPVEDDKNSFAHDQNRLRFEVLAPSLERQQDLTYVYRIKGIDESWNVNTYHQNNIEYKSLPPGEYEFEVELKYKNNHQEKSSIFFTIANPLWQQWWFITMIIAVFIGISYWYNSSRLSKLAKEAQQINELNDSKLTAIQSQMNPHFIFNALNSIQEYIVSNEKKQATKYLGMFADLMRIYLRQGKIKTVNIAEEIEALNIYLELEKMRFEDSFTHTIQVDEGIDQETFSIPSLLIQPYVENALKHGLLHKKGKRELRINFRINSGMNNLICEIIDNGIGREKSQEINKMRNPGHKSFASSATKRRLELLNYNNKNIIAEQTEDLRDEFGMGIGTKVTLSIPMEFGS